MASEPLLPRPSAAPDEASSVPRYGTMASEQPFAAGHIITSFLLANIHCPSCVSSIKEALHEVCGSDIVWVSPNIVTSVVTIEHRDTGRNSTATTIRSMAKALDLAGYEVCSVTTTATTSTSAESSSSTDTFVTPTQHQDPAVAQADRSGGSSGTYDDGALERLLRVPGLRRFSGLPLDRKRQAHLTNCEECRNSRPPSSQGHRDSSQEASLLKKAGVSSTDEALSHLEGVTVAGASTSTGTVAVSPGHWRASLSIGGMTCTSCVRGIEEGLSRNPSISNVAVNLVNNSAIVDFTGEIGAHTIVQAIEGLGYEATINEIIDLDRENKIPEKAARQWRASLSIGGMTCASCANSITTELDKKDWVSNVAVSLVSNSATVEFTAERKGKEIVEAIEDIGYEATLDTVSSLESDEPSQAQERTVQILIDGIFCKHCPGRLIHSLAAFEPDLKLLSNPSVEHPYLTVRYTPNAPTLTIRRVLDAIEAADPAFHASIHHPPTLEERSKALTARHQHQLLRRVYLCLIMAIPSFVIGIVYMNLVPDGDAGKHFLMEPWTSGISRAQVVLFVMATPVYFFATDVFHIRAAKELNNLWRRGSRMPIAKRFYKFGSMNLLISLGTTIAYVSSVAQMVAAAILRPDEVRDTHFYFDSVVFLTLFLLLGRVIEAYSKAKTGDAVEMLGKLRPSIAILVEKDGLGKTSDSVVAVDLVEFGDLVRVPHGASPVADGVMVSGNGNGSGNGNDGRSSSSFDESSLTGESRLIKKNVGDSLFAGTVNKGAAVLMRVTGAAGRSMLDQIVQVVREGQTKRAPMERVADLMTAYFVPIITLIAVLTWAVWTILGLAGALPDDYLDDEDAPSSGKDGGAWVTFALQFAIAVFVVACPCGLGLAAPTAIFVGGGLAAKHGILAKGGGEAFEKASSVDVVVFDKTGTLTVGGEPKITDSVAYPDATDPSASSQEDVVALVAALRAVEENSTHPVARAIVSYCASVTDRRAEVDGVEELPGRGMKAACRGDGDKGAGKSSFDMIVGNEALMRDFGVPVSSGVKAQLEDWKAEAKSVALVGTRARADASGTWTLAAALSVSDPVRAEAVNVVRALRAGGIDVWMLSGDNAVTARSVAARVGIAPGNVIVEVLPSEKADKIGYLQATLKARGRSRGAGGYGDGDYDEADTSRRATVAMVGDGINDSPALTRADVGVAVGSGSDVAISSADFVLVSNDLRAVATLLELSRAVFRRIRLNFAWAVVYNVLAIPVAAGCLYPLTMGAQGERQHVKLDPVWAALAMALSSISVVLSSLALRMRVPGVGFRPRVMAGRGVEDGDKA